MRVFDKFYIGGQWVSPFGTGTLEVVDSATEEVIATVPQGDASDIDRAVAAARGAFAGWSALPGEERGKLLAQVRDGIESRRAEFAETISHEVGMPYEQSLQVQLGFPITSFSDAAVLAETYPWESVEAGYLIAREPIGVVGAITPWNYPLNQIAAKVAYSLAAGCTVIIKPSEVAPINAFMLAEIFDEIGFPAGAFNLVTGLGPVVGEALAAHPDVDMISFTGSTRAGRRVSELAAQTVKRVALELGGKSPNIILEDADLETAVRSGVGKCSAELGQTCSALTRLIVPRSRLAEAEVIAADEAERYTVGDPFDSATKLGPLITSVQRDRVRSYIDTGVAEGARVLTGGSEPPDGLDQGYYVRPTVFSDVDNSMTIAQEEIFGPVLVMIGYDNEDDAIRIANDSPYGLSAGVWSGDPEHAHRVARQIRAGRVEIDGQSFGRVAPFGGYRQSGNGREFGRIGLEEFLEVKAMHVV